VIRLSGVCYRYRQDRPALNGVDLSVGTGERLIVAGASGSGKSTLLRLMNGLLTPTEGVVIVDGIDTADASRVWEVRRRVGLVFQNPDNQLVSTTVERELAFGMENLGLPPVEIREAVAALSADLSLDGLLGRAPHTLSGGEKQRVAIAAVLAMRPDVLALDEPTALLDGRGRSEVLGLIRELERDGRHAIVHVTQFPDEIALGTRVVVLAQGEIVFDGRPDELFSRRGDLERWGLSLPRAALLADRLRARGVNVGPGVLSFDGLVAALQQGGTHAP